MTAFLWLVLGDARKRRSHGKRPEGSLLKVSADVVPTHHCSAFTYDYSSLHPKLAATFSFSQYFLPPPPHPLSVVLALGPAHKIKLTGSLTCSISQTFLAPPLLVPGSFLTPGFPLWSKGPCDRGASELCPCGLGRPSPIKEHFYIAPSEHCLCSLSLRCRMRRRLRSDGVETGIENSDCFQTSKPQGCL